MDDPTEGRDLPVAGAAPEASAAWWSRPAEDRFAAPPRRDVRPVAEVPPGPAEDPTRSAQAAGAQEDQGQPDPWRVRPDGYGSPAPYTDGSAYGPPAGAPAYSEQGMAEPGWGAGQAPWGQTAPAPYGQAPYAQTPYGQAPPPGGAGWGGEQNPGASGPARRRGRLAVAAAVLAAGLVGGLGGGALVAARDGNGLTDPSASLGSGVSSSKTVERAPDSVAGIAGRVLRSTVSISVRTGSGGGSGSGVVLRADGYVLTNNHVVASGAAGGTITVTVNGSEGRAYPAKIVGRDPETDLAVLKVEGGAALVPATLGRSADLVVGDPVIAIGSPLGLNGTVTTGIVSALNRTVNVPAEGGGRATPLLNAIQTDAAINPGNSGGALVDIKGDVVGINSAIATLGSGDQSGSIGVGFAIGVDEARSVAEEIIRTGKATHPAVGVEAGNEVADDGTKQGARVTRVVGGGPADDAGLQVGDVVDRVGSTPVGSVDELILALRQSKVGDRVKVTYVRSGQTRTADVVLADKAAN